MWILTQHVKFLSYILHLSNTWKKKSEYNEAVHQLFTDSKKAYDSVSIIFSLIFLLRLVSP